MTLNEIIEQVRQLSPEERAVLMKEISAFHSDSPRSLTWSDFMKYEGIGRSLYTGRDAQEEINELRDEWDKR